MNYWKLEILPPPATSFQPAPFLFPALPPPPPPSLFGHPHNWQPYDTVNNNVPPLGEGGGGSAIKTNVMPQFPVTIIAIVGYVYRRLCLRHPHWIHSQEVWTVNSLTKWQLCPGNGRHLGLVSHAIDSDMTCTLMSPIAGCGCMGHQWS